MMDSRGGAIQDRPRDTPRDTVRDNKGIQDSKGPRDSKGPSDSTRSSGNSKSSPSTKPTENVSKGPGIKPGITINVTPDGLEVESDVTISASVGIASVSVQADGSVGVSAKVPVPAVPGLTANGGIVVNVLTGEVEKITLGASYAITEVSVTIVGCDIITSFKVKIPNTLFALSYDIYSELPGCKEKPEKPEGIQPGPGIDPSNYPPGGWNPFPAAFKECQIQVCISGATRFVRCHYPDYSSYAIPWEPAEVPLQPIPAKHNNPPRGISMGHFGEGSYENINPAPPEFGKTHELVIGGSFYTTITPYAVHFTEVKFENYKFDPLNPTYTAQLWPKPPETSPDYNVCLNVPGWLAENSPTGRVSGYKIIGYTMVCPFPIVNPPSIEDLNKPPNSEPPEFPSAPPPPPRIKDMEKCCAASTRMIRELHEFIKPQDLINSKLPKRLIYPDGKGEEKITCLGDFIRYLILEIDAKGFQPFSLEVRDTNAAQEGNQPLSITAYSLSAALKEILQYLIDTESDGDNANNMLVRLAYECSLIHKIAAVTQQQVDNIENFLDYEVRQEQVNLPMMFNMLAGVANKKKKGIDANDEVNTEAVMSELLQQVEHPIVVTKNVSRKQLTEALLELKQTMLTGGRDF